MMPHVSGSVEYDEWRASLYDEADELGECPDLGWTCDCETFYPPGQDGEPEWCSVKNCPRATCWRCRDEDQVLCDGCDRPLCHTHAQLKEGLLLCPGCGAEEPDECPF